MFRLDGRPRITAILSGTALALRTRCQSGRRRGLRAGIHAVPASINVIGPVRQAPTTDHVLDRPVGKSVVKATPPRVFLRAHRTTRKLPIRGHGLAASSGTAAAVMGAPPGAQVDRPLGRGGDEEMPLALGDGDGISATNRAGGHHVGIDPDVT